MQVPSSRRIVVLLSVLGGVAPIGLYLLAMSGVPRVTATEALALRKQSPDSVVLVDIRDSTAFQERRVAGAVLWPLSEIRARTIDQGLPDAIRDKRPILYCNNGFLTLEGVKRVRALGGIDPVMVQGGLATFTVVDDRVLNRQQMEELFEGRGELPYRDVPLVDQWALFLTGFVIKPLYMFLSFVLIVCLWRQTKADLAALRWALIFFLVGETACAVNYIVFAHESHLAEFIHSYSMVLTFAFLVFVMFETIDTRVIHFTDTSDSCALRPLCAVCHRNDAGVCGLVRLFQFIIPAMLVTSFMPLCFIPEMASYNTKILLTMYNSSHPVLYQIHESRVCPLFAAVLFGLSWWALCRAHNKDIWLARILFCAGVGCLGFGIFRVTLFAMFHENLEWFNSWEEITEFLLVAGIAAILHVFRKGLFMATLEQEGEGCAQ
ncbi:MAG: rhodanese-like domain-containing protein [Candidatus Hydrogenedentales bacterium]|jgi:rhodanese-related sulfurtransferase